MSKHWVIQPLNNKGPTTSMECNMTRASTFHGHWPTGQHVNFNLPFSWTNCPLLATSCCPKHVQKYGRQHHFSEKNTISDMLLSKVGLATGTIQKHIMVKESLTQGKFIKVVSFFIACTFRFCLFLFSTFLGVLFGTVSKYLKVVFLLYWDLDVSRPELSRDFGGREEALSCPLIAFRHYSICPILPNQYLDMIKL